MKCFQITRVIRKIGQFRHVWNRQRHVHWWIILWVWLALLLEAKNASSIHVHPNCLIIISCMFQECWPTWTDTAVQATVRPRRPRLVKLHRTKRDRKCREKPSKVHWGYQFQMSHCLLSGRKKVLRRGKILSVSHFHSFVIIREPLASRRLKRG